MVILGSRDLQAMTDIDTALLASGIDTIAWHAASQEGAYELHVDDARAPFAVEVIVAWGNEELERQAPSFPGQAAAQATAAAAALPMWQQPAFAWGLGMAALLLAFFAVTGGTEAHSIWYQRGVFIHDSAVPYAAWRWVTAATLHAHMAHASGNAGMAVVMFWAATERVGHGVATCIWLATAVAGFATSAMWGPAPAWVVGASGGLFGLWGAICGHAWRFAATQGYKPRMRTVGVVVMLMGMLAFAHDADIAAHLGGCAAGMALGLACPRAPLGALWQWLGVAASAAVVVWSWRMALGHG